MKSYTVSVDIDLPRDRVLELFDDPDNLKHWQTGLESFEHLSGTPGEPGAKSKLTYKSGKSTFDLIETITRKQLPDEFDGTYEWDGGRNTLANRFIELAPDKTRWESTCGYEFSKLMLKVMGAVTPGVFKRQNQKYLDNFKAFAEEGKSVAGSSL